MATARMQCMHAPGQAPDLMRCHERQVALAAAGVSWRGHGGARVLMGHRAVAPLSSARYTAPFHMERPI